MTPNEQLEALSRRLDSPRFLEAYAKMEKQIAEAKAKEGAKLNPFR